MNIIPELLKLAKKGLLEDVSRVEELFEEYWKGYIDGDIVMNYEVARVVYPYLIKFGKFES